MCRLLAALIAIASSVLSTAAFAQESVCGEPPVMADETLAGDITGRVAALSAMMGSTSSGKTINAARTEIFSKYPNADQRVANVYFQYQLCVLLMSDTSLSSVEKIDALSKLRQHFSRDVQISESPLDSPRLYPVRDFIEPDQIPPRDVGAYGMVAFTQKATSATRQRFTYICEAFLSTLPARGAIPSSIPIGQLMITYWPIEEREPDKIAAGDCEYLVDRYDLFSGLEAVRDADLRKHRLAESRGPFLIGWSPARSRYEKDAVVLVMDLSDLESDASFREAFQSWRTKITDKPELWRNGFSLYQIRLALRDFLDRYGEGILKAITPG